MSKLQNSILDELQAVQRLVLVPVVGGEPEEHSLVQLHAVQLGPGVESEGAQVVLRKHCYNTNAICCP